MVSEFVERTRGSKRVQALPACRKSARPTENPQCGFADFGRFSLWRPTVVERTRGSNRVQAQPAGSQWAQAQPAGSQWVQAQPAGSKRVQAQPACWKSARPTENPQRGFADFGRFNLWRPTVVERTRGSRWVRALPGQKSRLSNVAFYRNVRVWATVCSWPGSTRIMPGLWVSCWSQST